MPKERAVQERTYLLLNAFQIIEQKYVSNKEHIYLQNYFSGDQLVLGDAKKRGVGPTKKRRDNRAWGRQKKENAVVCKMQHS